MKSPVFQPNAARTKVLDSSHIVADKENRPPRFRHLPHFAQALLLEGRVADGQHFIHQENFRFQMSRHGKGQPHIHSARISFDRRVNKLLQLRKSQNLIKLRGNFMLFHPQNDAIHKDVFAAGQLRMKTRAHLQQRTHAPINDGPTGGRFRDAGQHLEQRGLARAIPTDNPHHLPLLHIKGHIAQRPELFRTAALLLHHALSGGGVPNLCHVLPWIPPAQFMPEILRLIHQRMPTNRPQTIALRQIPD